MPAPTPPAMIGIAMYKIAKLKPTPIITPTIPITTAVNAIEMNATGKNRTAAFNNILRSILNKDEAIKETI